VGGVGEPTAALHWDLAPSSGNVLKAEMRFQVLTLTYEGRCLNRTFRRVVKIDVSEALSLNKYSSPQWKRPPSVKRLVHQITRRKILKYVVAFIVVTVRTSKRMFFHLKRSVAQTRHVYYCHRAIEPAGGRGGLEFQECRSKQLNLASVPGDKSVRAVRGILHSSASFCSFGFVRVLS
jgi:hypothetical protein